MFLGQCDVLKSLRMQSYSLEQLRWLQWSRSVFLARSSSSEELVWLLGGVVDTLASVVDNEQLGLLGHLQPGTSSLGTRR